MAAEDEGKNIDFKTLTTFCQEKRNTDYLLIEGAGGIMSPIGKTHTVLDWIEALDYEIILITGSYLGSISHTLTAYEAIAARKLKLHSLIVNESETSPVSPERIVLTIKRFLPNNLPVNFITRAEQKPFLKSILP
jgi:dethiobiotin synthetase